MSCTTILVGKKATYDGSTMIARNDDCPSGQFHAKKLIVVHPEEQPRPYRSKISRIEIDLPEECLRYTCMPSVDDSDGIWGAAGTNSENVSMTATETITTNERVLASDPLCFRKDEYGKLQPDGIGEEDLLVLILPYIHSAREGVIRLAELLETYGTYESNGIAFADKDEIWWVETIGGHHYIAKKVPDDRYVIMPNQFGMDEFDFEDAYGDKQNHMCSSDLRFFIEENHLNLNINSPFNPRLAFGSHSDSDHVYNTPRAWFMARYLNPNSYTWEGPNANFTPLSDDIPWSLVPERKITVEDIKYLLSSHYQGTPYDPYAKFGDPSMRGAYRPIGISRTSFLSLHQTRPYVPNEASVIEWIAFGSNAFNAFVPLYANVEVIPDYFSKTPLLPNSEHFYWANRFIGALADPHFNACAQHIERYRLLVQSQALRLIRQNDDVFGKYMESNILQEANKDIAELVKKETDALLDKILYTASCLMKNGYNRSDN